MLKKLRVSLFTISSAGILLSLLFLSASKAHSLQTETPGIIQGWVTDVDHQPLASIAVEVHPFPSASSAGTRTLADGSYQLTVPPGTYVVFIGSDELYTTPQIYVPKYYPNAFTQATAQWITVASNTIVDHIDIQLDRYGVIEGRVTDEHGQPLPKLQITAYKQYSDTTSAFMPYGYPRSSDAWGHYRIPELRDGVYKLLFADPHRPAQVESEYFSHSATLTDAQKINIHLNQVITNINLGLTHKTAVAPFRLRQIATTPLFPGLFLAMNTSEQLIYSRDGGHKWLRLTTPVTPVLSYGDFPLNLTAIAPRTNVTQPIRLLFATNDSIYRTGDLGASWAKQTITANPECNTPVTILSLADQPMQPTHVSGYAVCMRQDGDYTVNFSIEFHSDDGGATWVQNPTSANPLSDLSAFGPVVAVDGNHPATSYQVSYEYTVTQVGNGQQTFFQVSNDAGQTWSAKRWLPFCGSYEDLIEKIEKLSLYWLPVQQGSLVLACKQGLFRSVDQGNTWKRAPIEFSQGDFGFMADYGHPSHLLWERDTGLWVSDDAGETWTRLTQDYAAIQLYLPHILRS